MGMAKAAFESPALAEAANETITHIADRVIHNSRVAIRRHALHEWMVASRDGWWPVEEVDQDTLDFLDSFRSDTRLPVSFRAFVQKLNEPAKRIARQREYPNLVILHGVNLSDPILA
jgi:hypothetical protein